MTEEKQAKKTDADVSPPAESVGPLLADSDGEEIDAKEDASDVPYQVAESAGATEQRFAHELFALHTIEKKSGRDTLGVSLLAVAVFISGLVGVVHPLFVRVSAHPRLFEALVPYALYHWSRSLTTAFGFMLIYVSLNLYRRKRMAWVLALALTTLSFINLLARVGSERIAWITDHSLSASLPITVLLPPLVVLALLFGMRKTFTVRSEQRGITKALKFVAVSFGIAMFYGSLGFWLLDRSDFGVNFSWAEAMLRTLRELTLQGNNDLVPHTRQAAYFIQSLRVVGTLAGVFSLYSIFRPLEYELSTLPRERAKAKAILDKYGRSALDEMKLLSDKSYFFGANEDSFVAFKTVNNIAVALGDPVAGPADFAATTSAFVEGCHTNGWKVAFMQTTPDFLPVYEKLGLDVLKVGEDGVVDIDQFCTSTIKAKTFKAPLRKFDKQGFNLERTLPPHSSAVFDAVQKVSDEWLSLPGRKERGFSLWKFDRAVLQSHPIYLLKDEKGDVIAFVDQIPSFAPGEATIDMMRHRKDVPGGTMDYLFGKLILSLQEQGFKRFSLGLAALSGVGDKPDANIEEKAAFLIYNKLNRFFSYKGLRAYKQKFDPTWEDRFLVYEGGPAGLVRTAAALIGAMRL